MTTPPEYPEDAGRPPADAPQPRQHLSARVPEHVGRGIFSTGVLVMTGGAEFILDFIQNLGQPAQVAARVVIPHATMPQFIKALETNLKLYRDRFGGPAELPPPAADQPKRTLQELYDDLKVPDDVLAGAYANGVMIGHGASEFKFDFLANVMPQPAVSCRVYLAAPHVPRLLQSLSTTYEEYQKRVRQQQERTQQPPPQDDAEQPPPS